MPESPVSAPSRRAASAIVFGAALAGFLAPAAAQATPAPVHPARAVVAAADRQPRWTSATMPVAAGVVFDTVQLDAHTTWAYGVELNTTVGPLLMTRNDQDGRGWTQLPTDALGEKDRINSVSVLSPNDAWLVGDYSATAGGIVTAHWDGAAMTTVDAPIPAAVMDAGFLSVSARASGDVWATGWVEILDSSEPDPNKPGGVIQVTHNEALVEHWDGHAWRRATVPDEREMVLQSVLAFSPTNVWAAGYTGEDQPALLHFDGRAWSAPVPAPYAGLYGEVQSLAANGPDDIWAVGRAVLDEDEWGHALVTHWDGHRWQQVATPADAGRLSDVATVPGGIAVTGSTVDQLDGYATRLVNNHWQSLGIPVDGTTHLMVNGVSWSGGRLTVTGDSESDASPFQQPLVLTGQL
ncbi:MAG TPA: hypothetical protein VGJ07_27270 [Rugosimonospora sp.]